MATTASAIVVCELYLDKWPDELWRKKAVEKRRFVYCPLVMNGDAPRFLVSFSAFSSRFVSFLPSFFFFFCGLLWPYGAGEWDGPKEEARDGP